MFMRFACHYLCLVMIELCFGLVLVVCVREQRRNSAIFT